MEIAVAYCWASGEIGIAAESDDFDLLPEGVIEFARGEIAELTRRIEVRARRAYKPGLYLVPGLPEFPDIEEGELQAERVTVLMKWVDWAFSDWPLDRENIRTQPVKIGGRA